MAQVRVRERPLAHTTDIQIPIARAGRRSSSVENWSGCRGRCETIRRRVTQCVRVGLRDPQMHILQILRSGPCSRLALAVDLVEHPHAVALDVSLAIRPQSPGLLRRLREARAKLSWDGSAQFTCAAVPAQPTATRTAKAGRPAGRPPRGRCSTHHSRRCPQAPETPATHHGQPRSCRGAGLRPRRRATSLTGAARRLAGRVRSWTMTSVRSAIHHRFATPTTNIRASAPSSSPARTARGAGRAGRRRPLRARSGAAGTRPDSDRPPPLRKQAGCREIEDAGVLSGGGRRRFP